MESEPPAPGDLLRTTADLHRVSRRRFLAGSLAGIVLSADLVVTDRVQRYREELEILRVPDDDAERRFPHAMWFLFPGYKTSWEETGWLLRSLRPALATRGQLAGIGYSNLGLKVPEILEAVHASIREHSLTRIYFYGHSFGGMLAVQVAAGLASRGVAVDLIVLDSSPSGRNAVRDQAMFKGAVFLYDNGYRITTGLRGGYELGERMLHRNERSWRTVAEQTLEQLSPLAPSSRLIQSQASYIYHFTAPRFSGSLGGTKLAFIGNPEDGTVDYGTARAGWEAAFPENLLTSSLVTEGARPAHASPQWNPAVYEDIVLEVLRLFDPPEPAEGPDPLE
ncbi:thioesterase domain-containing protein [Arthrobacter sp. zg-Y1110]|uniref:thioesterase domain-containing protein n=1 Tax=Arthrobacter sp. zg-Y1110 TaxID=2886932 RepID=UPI001D14C039|nr:alpha/beta fold hydrolase [Arthrobacter sp. zg-Y1110]MCC3289397.1 alpha/beta fold hydrolase [Arthrobacter sp. zg-Y1110]UWX85157.1 alpha/beta fold hydrolase [Arthrobacter sp. zg-Y1110]